MISKPIDGFIKAPAPKGSISQYFGENPELYNTRVCVDASAGGKLCLIGHNGIDIVAPYYTPILCVETGYVLETKEDPGGFGKHVRIISKRGPQDYEWVYGHFADITCKPGDWVSAGDVIGHMGNTGFVVTSSNADGFWKPGSNQYAGTHLHLGIRKYGMTRDEFMNGFFGYFDFLDQLPDDEQVDVVANTENQQDSRLKQILWFLKRIILLGLIKK